MPLVSVVVICYNDATHLPAAVRSVTRQTLRDLEIFIVDDASTDASPQVAARLAADDPRIRVIRLDSNSGGCSRPRNAGLEQASGRYVMFVDSDDELAPRAAARLVAAAERTGADLACGRYVRRHHHPRRLLTANDDLYLRPAFLTSIADRPRQLYDTPAWNKLYRRAFIERNALRFPEGLLYEDLLFTTEAYCSANGIAVVPHLIYIWHVRRQASALSITNRGDLRNWRDRFEVHRRIDDFLATHQVGPALITAKRAKFLDVDFALFLRELRMFPPSSRAELVELARSYLTTVDLADSRDARPEHRVAAFLAAQGDVDGTVSAADWSATGGVGSNLVLRDGRLLWTQQHLAAPGASTALDVSSTGLAHASFASTPFLAVVSTVTRTGAVLHLEGRVHDVLDRLQGTTAATVTVRGRAGVVLWRGPATVSDQADGLAFDGAIDLHGLGRGLWSPRVGHELRVSLQLRRNGSWCDRPLTARDATLPVEEIDVPTPWRRLVGDRVRVAEVNGRLVLTLSALPRHVDAAIHTATLLRSAARRSALRARDARSRLSRS